MTMPIALVVLLVLALVLHIVFQYFVNTNGQQWPLKPVIALVIIVLTLVVWFVLPVRIG